MSQEAIIRMARSAIRLAAKDTDLTNFDQEATILDRYEFLYWFAKEVAAAEREAIAQMFDDPPPLVPDVQNKRGGCLVCGFTPAVAAKAIRARGETK